MNAAERFFAKTKPDGNGCLIWTGGNNGQGYGVFFSGERTTPAHRWLWERLIGYQDGLVADHLCRNPSCVRPSHIEFVTHRENVRRGEAANAVRARSMARTHCSKGHLLTTKIRVDRNGGVHRDCDECKLAKRRTPQTRAWHAAWKRNHRAKNCAQSAAVQIYESIVGELGIAATPSISVVLLTEHHAQRPIALAVARNEIQP